VKNVKRSAAFIPNLVIKTGELADVVIMIYPYSNSILFIRSGVR
jgi:hypothetical protein